MKKDAYFRYVLGALLLLGAVARVFGAWCYRLTSNPDAGVACLMTKHIAEGQDFPVFFYGQSYMGSFEPAVSALFCRLFGMTDLMACMGTAFLGFCLLPVIYLWGKNACSRTAGIAALAYSIIGPGAYFHYQASPRGGYAATLFAGTLTIWLSSKIISKESDNERPNWKWFFPLGFAAGIGWWSNQLVTPAILTAALLFLVLLRKNAFTWRLIPGICGFFLGSLPLWIWNILNNWTTFNLLQSFGRTTMGDGLKFFFYDRLLQLMGWHVLPAPWRILNIALLISASIVTVTALVWSARKDKKRFVHLLAVFMFILVSALVFSRSHFAQFVTPRYLLPVVPALAVVFGCGTAYLTKRFPWGLGWLPLAVLIGFQVPHVTGSYARSKVNKNLTQLVYELGDSLRQKNIKTALSSNNHYEFNFRLREEFCFCDFKHDRYPPYRRTAELDSNISVLDNCGNISGFLACAGGTAERDKAGGIIITYNFSPPENGMSEVAPLTWKNVRTSQGNSPDQIMDRNADTYWKPPTHTESDQWLDVTFSQPTAVSCVRFTSRNNSMPPSWSIDGMSQDKGDWHNFAPKAPVSAFFWSGPRPYWNGRYFRAEYRFPPETVTALRLRFAPNNGEIPWNIAELQIFGADSELKSEKDAFPELENLLVERKITRLYSDRWVANQIYKRYQDRIRTELEPLIFGSPDSTAASLIQFEPRTALAVRRENAPLCRHVLSMRQITMRETELEPWVIFDFDPRQWKPRYADNHALCWSGFTCLLTQQKRWATTLMQWADSASTQDRVAMLEKAAEAYPDYLPAMDKLALCLRETGQEDEAQLWEDRSTAIWKPRIPADIRFSNGVKLTGISLDKMEVRPGQHVIVKYYWQCPPETDTRLFAAFVHFEREHDMFQDDHVLLEGINTAYQPFPEVFVERRIVRIPPDTKSGNYVMVLGLLDRRPGGKRLKARTRLPRHRRAITLPVALEILAH